MKPPSSIYTHCDELEHLPELFRCNWLWELDRLAGILPEKATALQVGSMDGTRILRLLEKRPDVRITGLEIDAALAERARENLTSVSAKTSIVTGDILDPPADLQRSQYVLCLNNTLGYIADEPSALSQMKKLGARVIVSVYGEQCTDALAREYFLLLGLEIDHIENHHFIFKDFTSVKRYTREEVERWGGEITETPLGYLCTL